MATLIEAMPAPGGKTPPAAYPWDRWLLGVGEPAPHFDVDGKRRVHLARGVDFTVKASSMRAYVYRAAGDMDLTVGTVMDADGRGISILVTQPTAVGSAPAAGNPVVVR